VQTTRRGWLAALQYRDFRLLLIGEVTSAIGTEMLYVALNWQMYLLTHSALALGLLGLAGFIPALLFSLLGGNFADAHNRKKILYITQPIFMLCSSRWQPLPILSRLSLCTSSLGLLLPQ
jgi:MFS family permease